jgi:hypothetical protein
VGRTRIGLPPNRGGRIALQRKSDRSNDCVGQREHAHKVSDQTTTMGVTTDGSHSRHRRPRLRKRHRDGRFRISIAGALDWQQIGVSCFADARVCQRALGRIRIRWEHLHR